jgi:amino acid transporter
MKQANTPATPQLARALSLRDLVLMNIVAVLGLRHLGTSAAAGPVTLTLWLLAALFFFVPLGLAVVELSSRFPNSGGVYDWTKRALGEGHGFVCGWCYWINNVLYYPNLLMSAAVVAAYAIRNGDSPLKDDLVFVITTTLVCLWLAVILNIVGVGTGKWLQNVGGLGTYLPGALVILVGIYAWDTQPAANLMAARDLVPQRADYDSLNLWIAIAFAYSGIEVATTMGDEVENPRRNLPLSILIAAPLIGLVYLLGTGAVLWLIPRNEVNVVAGFLQAIQVGLAQLSPQLFWVTPACALFYLLGNLGGVGAWLTGPARVAFAIGLDRYFPPAFGRVHPRWRTPYVAILVQAALGTILLLIFVAGKDTKVGQVYLILLSAQVLIYFIPYVYLFVVFILHRRRAGVSTTLMAAPGGMLGVYVLGLSGLSVTLFAMVLALIPPGNTSWFASSGKALLGVIGLLALGGLLYWRARRQSTNAAKI